MQADQAVREATAMVAEALLDDYDTTVREHEEAWVVHFSPKRPWTTGGFEVWVSKDERHPTRLVRTQ
jgi:hypothetical protein